MSRHTFWGFITRSSLVVLGFTAVMWVVSFIFFTQHPITSLRKNRLESIKIERKDLLNWLFNSVGIYFFNTYLPTWQKGIRETKLQRKEQKKLLNYHLLIEHIIDRDPKIVVNHHRPTLYLHGWGDTKDSAKLIKAFCEVIPGDVVTFNFRDAGVLLPKLTYANLGQVPDVLSTIYVLKWMRDTLNVQEVDLFGYSRGGATLLNTIAVLNDKNGTYDQDLGRIGITKKDRSELLSMIQKGAHVLNCPLTDMNTTISEFVQSKHPGWINAFSSFTRYKKDGLQGLTSALSFQGLKLNILAHFQYRDTIISNKNEALLYSRLAQHNPLTTFMVLGNDGGHMHRHTSLAQTVHPFKRLFGSSHDPEYVRQYGILKQHYAISNRLLRPKSQQEAERIISNYYSECAQQEEQKKLEQLHSRASINREQKRKN